MMGCRNDKLISFEMLRELYIHQKAVRNTQRVTKLMVTVSKKNSTAQMLIGNLVTSAIFGGSGLGSR